MAVARGDGPIGEKSGCACAVRERWGAAAEAPVRVICIQGPSTSGKSTLAQKIEAVLAQSGRRFFTLHLDDFYKSQPAEAVAACDFDNPAAFDWDGVFQTIRGIHDGDEFLRVQGYDYVTAQSSGSREIRNPRPEFLVVEGIYAFYAFCRLFFDLDALSPFRPNAMNAAPLVESPRAFPRFAVLRVLLATCKAKILSVRLVRDVTERGKAAEKVAEDVEKNVWPATLRWICTPQTIADVRIDHGTFNARQTHSLVAAIAEFLGLGRQGRDPGSIPGSDAAICEFCSGVAGAVE